jgi:hypothetical protein
VTNASEVLWSEPLASGVIQGAAAVGINHANEAKDNYETFIAGALIALAGGALLAAVQEWLHRNDDAATAKAMIRALKFPFGDGRAQDSERDGRRQEAGEEEK